MAEDASQRYKYSFGNAEFDEARFELRVDRCPVKVEHKPLELLLVLLQHGGEVVARDVLREQLWARADPVDYVMANAVRKLRRALGPANEGLIVTQPKRGYRLAVAPRRVALGSGLAALKSAKLRVTIQEAHAALNELHKAIAEGRLAVDSAIKAAGPLSELAVLARLQLAADLARGGHYDEAVTMLDQVEADLAGDASSRPLDWARLHWVRSDLQAFRLELEASLRSAQMACEQLALGVDLDPRLADGVRTRLGKARRMLGDYVGSEAAFRDLVTMQEARDSADAEATQQGRLQLARSLMFQDRNIEALDIARDASQRLAARLGSDNLATQHANDAIASIQFKMADYLAAAATWQEVVHALACLSGCPSDFWAAAQANLALALLYAGKLTESEVAGRRALELTEAILAADSPRAQSIRYQIAFAVLDQGKMHGVAQLLDGLEPAALRRAIQADDWAGRLAYQRGRLAYFQGRPQEALGLLEEAELVLAARNSKGLVSPPLVGSWSARIREALGSRRR